MSGSLSKYLDSDATLKQSLESYKKIITQKKSALKKLSKLNKDIDFWLEIRLSNDYDFDLKNLALKMLQKRDGSIYFWSNICLDAKFDYELKKLAMKKLLNFQDNFSYWLWIYEKSERDGDLEKLAFTVLKRHGNNIENLIKIFKVGKYDCGWRKNSLKFVRIYDDLKMYAYNKIQKSKGDIVEWFSVYDDVNTLKDFAYKKILESTGTISQLVDVYMQHGGVDSIFSDTIFSKLEVLDGTVKEWLLVKKCNIFLSLVYSKLSDKDDGTPDQWFELYRISGRELGGINIELEKLAIDKLSGLAGTLGFWLMAYHFNRMDSGLDKLALSKLKEIDNSTDRWSGWGNINNTVFYRVP